MSRLIGFLGTARARARAVIGIACKEMRTYVMNDEFLYLHCAHQAVDPCHVGCAVSQQECLAQNLEPGDSGSQV